MPNNKISLFFFITIACFLLTTPHIHAPTGEEGFLSSESLSPLEGSTDFSNPANLQSTLAQNPNSPEANAYLMSNPSQGANLPLNTLNNLPATTKEKVITDPSFPNSKLNSMSDSALGSTTQPTFDKIATKLSKSKLNNMPDSKLSNLPKEILDQVAPNLNKDKLNNIPSTKIAQLSSSTLNQIYKDLSPAQRQSIPQSTLNQMSAAAINDISGDLTEQQIQGLSQNLLKTLSPTAISNIAKHLTW